MVIDAQTLELKSLHANEIMLNITQASDIQTEVTKSETRRPLSKSEMTETT